MSLAERFEKIVPVFAYIFGKEGVEDWKRKLLIIVGCEAVFLLTALADIFTGGRIHSAGIHPRELSGLLGVFLGPFIHTDFTQCLVNLAPFAVLSGFVLMREDGVTTWGFLTFMEVTIGGFCVWAVGRTEADHNGASGLILAYFAFLIVFGAIRREARAALIAVVTVVVYGGLVWTTLPNRDTKISWEGHLIAIAVGAMFGTWEADIVHLKASGATAGGAGASGGAKTEPGGAAEKAPLTSDDVSHDDGLHDSEVGGAAGGVSGAK